MDIKFTNAVKQNNNNKLFCTYWSPHFNFKSVMYFKEVQIIKVALYTLNVL